MDQVVVLAEAQAERIRRREPSFGSALEVQVIGQKHAELHIEVRRWLGRRVETDSAMQVKPQHLARTVDEPSCVFTRKHPRRARALPRENEHGSRPVTHDGSIEPPTTYENRLSSNEVSK